VKRCNDCDQLKADVEWSPFYGEWLCGACEAAADDAFYEYDEALGDFYGGD
jgi:hypothetical protein